MISYFKIFKKNKLNRGMTYVELIVVLSIFAILSSVAIYNYNAFQAKVDIKNLASDIALKIVEAQKSSLNGLVPVSGVLNPDTWKPSYGVFFNSSTINDTDDIALNKKFIYFTDLDNPSPQNHFYDGLPSCTTAECLDKILITKGNYISQVGYNTGGSAIVPITGSFSVTFKRPDSSAIFYLDGNPFPVAYYIQININSPKAATAVIKIYPSGRIQVN